MADNVCYLNGYQQPRDAQKGLKALKKIISLRSVGVWLQTNNINAKVTGYGYPTGSLGNDKQEAEYTKSGNNIAVVDDTTGIFTVANYAQANAGPELSAEIIKSGDEYTAVENKLRAESTYAASSMIFTLYKLESTGTATSSYDVYLPASSKNAEVYSYADGVLTKLDATNYDDCTKKVTVDKLTYLVVADKVYKASFTKGEGIASVDVYYTQDYKTIGEKNASGAIARDDGTGMNDVTGNGQVNFKVNLKDGYKIKSITIDNNQNYKNLKGPDETEEARVYRITKITGDITINIEAELATQYNAVFEKDTGVASIDLYHKTIRNETDAAAANESNVESGVVRNGDTGEIDISGEGQVNFKVNVAEGMIVKKITVTGSSYSNIKGKDDTGVENLYRVTKITGDVKIKIETESKAQNEASAYNATFNKDTGVSSIDVYYTQNYGVASETDVVSTLVRDDVTGACDYSGDGQVNFKVNVKDGYKIKAITIDNNQNYKNLKGPDETKAENVYRVTKVKGNIRITVETEKIGSISNDETVPSDAETLTGTEWWSGMQTGKNYKLVGDGTIKLKVKVESGGDAGSVFYAEVAGTDAAGKNYFLTTGSNIDAWAVEAVPNGENIPLGNLEKSPDVVDSNQCTVGHTYIITVTRAGNKFTVNYYDDTVKKNHFNVVWTWAQSKMPKTVNLHILAQVGRFRVWQIDENKGQSGNNQGGSTNGDKGQSGNSTAASLKLSKESVKLYTGKASNKITVKATLKGAKGTVSWKSDNKKVATVNKTGNTATIKAVGAGTTRITATCGKAKATVRVVVNNPTITVKKGSKSVGSSLSLKKKKKVTLTVTVKPKKSGVSLLKLSRKDKKIVSASLKGSKLTIKGKKKGSAVISVKSGKKTKKIKVKVK